MKRYCISDEVYEKAPASKISLRIHPQTLMEFAKNVNLRNDVQQKDESERDRMVSMLRSKLDLVPDESFNRIDRENKIKRDFFSECNEDILALYNGDTFASNEEEMYETILWDILQMPTVCIDINLHIYYTILYQENKGKYTNLLQDNWTKEEKEDFREKRKSYKAYKKRTEGHYIPFKIDDSTPEKRIQIQDFAPNLIRLYYSNSELRNIFTDTKSADTKKYYSVGISSVYQSPYIHLEGVEEIWLLERILGINLARELYSLFSRILPTNFSLVESKYQPLIIEIVREIMNLQGVYSRCLLVHKLKEILKIRRYGHEIEQSEPYEIMTYLKQILKNCVNSISEEFDYREHKEYQIVKEEATKKRSYSLNNNCKELLGKYFHVENGYYILNENESLIKNERLYSLIQKAIIYELKI